MENMENMERKLSEIEVRLNEIDDLTQASAKIIKVLTAQVATNAENTLEANGNVLKLAKLIMGEKIKNDDPVDEKKYLTWGEFSIHPKYNIPILEIKVECGEESETFGYVSPFRGYFFQISKSYDGEFDLASYRAQHGTMANAFRGCNRALKEDIYRTMLWSTILHCLSNNYGKDLHPSHRLMAEYMKDSPIETFINASIDWVEKLS